MTSIARRSKWATKPLNTVSTSSRENFLAGPTIARSVKKTGRLLVVDETFAPCGIGAEIAAQIADRCLDDLDAPIRRLNGAHAPTPYSPPLEAAVVPNPDTIAQAIRDLLAE